jgi:membrane-bound metal-dependent hydrolase YbcI (DUF457 family)
VNGRNHVLSGGLAGVALGVGLAVLSVEHGEALAVPLVVAGFSVWPDVDHHCATPAQTLGPITRKLCGRLEAAVGHRGPTHSAAFAAATGVAVWAASAASPYALAAVFGLCAFWTLDLVGPGRLRSRWVPRAVVAILAGLVAFWHLHAGPWIGLAAALGCLAHLAGDSLTHAPMPLAWPARRRYALGWLPTGKRGEAVEVWISRALGACLFVAAVWLLPLSL